MKSILFITIFICFLSSHGFAQEAIVFDKKIFVERNDTLPYRLLHPKNYNADKKYPLLVFLHGSGARGNDNEAQLSNLPDVFLADSNRIKFPCFIFVPQCPKNDVWVNFPDFPKSLKATDTPTTAARMVLTLISDLISTLHIDTNRIYLTGYSMGGEGTFDMIARQPDLFAAAAPVCPVADTSNAHLIKHICTWTFHGAEDKVNDVTYSRMMVAALKRQGGDHKYTEYLGVAHRAWVNAYQEKYLLPWLFSQVKKSK